MHDTRLRRGTRADLPALTGIYNHYVREIDLETHTVEGRAAWMDGFAEGGRHQLFVAERAGRVIGYACTRRFRDKAAYDTTLEGHRRPPPDRRDHAAEPGLGGAPRAPRLHAGGRDARGGALGRAVAREPRDLVARTHSPAKLRRAAPSREAASSRSPSASATSPRRASSA